MSEKINVQVNISVRTATGAVVADKTVSLDVTAGMLPASKSLEKLILVQPASDHGSYAVYACQKDGLFGSLIGDYWVPVLNAQGVETRPAKFNLINASIAAEKLKSGGYVPVMNKKTNTPVYSFTTINTNPLVPMTAVFEQAKLLVATAIGGSGICQPRVADESAAVTTTDEVAVCVASIPNPLETPVVVAQ